MCALAQLLSPVWLFETRKEYWSVLPFPSPGESSRPRDWAQVACIVGGFFTTEPPGKPLVSVLRDLKIGHQEQEIIMFYGEAR